MVAPMVSAIIVNNNSMLPPTKKPKLDKLYTHFHTKPMKLENLFRRSNSFQREENHAGGRNVRPRPRRLGGVNESNFFTLRMEHREGGVMAKHPGEERILIFRSDRPGAIGKIIFSSTPSRHCSDEVTATENNEDDDDSLLQKMAQAKIHVLDVKDVYRGRDLGGLLFSEALTALKNRYYEDEDDGMEVDKPSAEDRPSVPSYKQRPPSLSSSVHCQLDAEEDVRRYNKLIEFYEQLGCRVKPKAKVRFLNNNDGETYRSVPMQITLRGLGFEKFRKKNQQWSSLVDRSCSFLPVELLAPNGRRAFVPALHTGSRADENTSERKVDWLIVEDGDNGVLFRTTQGQRLFAIPDGSVMATVGEDALVYDWECFKLSKVPDNEASGSDHSETENGWQKELWLVQSSHGSYLSADPDSQSLWCSPYPSYWQADGDALSLRCTRDTPPRRQHYRKTWARQSVDYVQMMRGRYLDFKLKKMGLREALEMVKAVSRHPFKVSNDGLSLRSFLFRFAEASRRAGHPDWVQFICLIHELGRVVNCIDVASAMDSQDYDWTITIRSRVVGCIPPRRTTFAEFRNLNSDLHNDNYNTAQGMYEDNSGIRNLLLTWTGPEYMYHMLKHNSAGIPEEGLTILRLFSLSDWHSNSEYARFADEDDSGIQAFVTEFDSLRRKVKSTSYEELSDMKCDKLWDEHYSHIVLKYGCDGDLKW